MPTDPQTQQLDDTEILETLEAIENIFDNTDFHDVLLGGDFNYDKSRNSRFVRIMDNFLEKHGLVSIWTKFDVDFTFQHLNLTSFSTIDHFFVTENFLVNCVDAAPIHLGDNRSNHSPIMIKIRLPDVLESRQREPVKKVCKVDWINADHYSILDYKDALHSKLSMLNLPDTLQCSDVLCSRHHHSLDRDSFLIDILLCMVETSFECLPTRETVINTQNRKGAVRVKYGECQLFPIFYRQLLRS